MTLKASRHDRMLYEVAAPRRPLVRGGPAAVVVRAGIAGMVVLALLAGGFSAGRVSRASADACAGLSPCPYLHTSGAQIVDDAGAPVRLRAVNWYGFDSNDFVAAGLHYWSYKTIIARIKSMGFNALRLPFSNELVERDPVVSALDAICKQGSCVPVPGTAATPISGSYLLAAISDTVSNSDLFDLDALHVLKTIVDYAGQQGLYVILDDHRSQAGWGPQEEGLWYTTGVTCRPAVPYTCYDPRSWQDDWQTVGNLFAADPNVIGMDLRNEPHSVSAPATCADYVNGANGAHWGTCQGQNTDATDWAQAATLAGNLLLGINPHWLVFVEGVSTYPNFAGSQVSFPTDGWGENLQGVASDPISLTVSNQLVYSPHDYRWDQVNAAGVTAMYGAWNRAFGFVAVSGSPFTAPLWVGEYGTCTYRATPPFSDPNTCVMSTPPGTPSYDEAGWWFNTFRFYEENQCLTDTTTNSQVCPAGPAPSYMGGPLSWAYWPVNGTYVDSWSYANNKWQSCYGQRESYGVLGTDMATVASPLLLRTLIQGPSADPATTLASATPPSGPWPSYTCSPYSAVPATPTTAPTATSTNTPIPPTSMPIPPPATPIPPTNTPVPPTATPTNTPIPPTATSTSTPIPPTATATKTPLPPMATATRTPAPTSTPANGGAHHGRPPALELTIRVNARTVLSGQVLGYLIQTVARAHVDATLQVVINKVVISGHGKQRKRVTHSVVLYRMMIGGTADVRGRFSGRMRVGYTPSRSVRAALVVTARSSHAVSTRTAWVTIHPRHNDRPRAGGAGGAGHAHVT